MSRMRKIGANFPPAGRFLASALVVILLIGCDSDRQAVEGTVTLDGQPLAEGYVRLRPQSGTSSPGAGASVENGKFRIAPEGGIFAGKFLVEITAMRPSGRMLANPESGSRYAEKVQILPPRYNKATELSVDIVEGESNHCDFKLTSK